MATVLALCLPGALVARSAQAFDPGPDPEGPDSPGLLHFDGFVRPALEWREATALDDAATGLSFLDSELALHGHADLGHGVSTGLLATLEMEDARFEAGQVQATVAWHGRTLALDVGRLKLPFTRQTLLPEWTLAVAPASLLRVLGHGRDYGARLRGSPRLGPLRLGWYAGVFNGEGPGGGGRNPDDEPLYAARLELGSVERLVDEVDLSLGPLRWEVGVSASHTDSIGVLDLGPLDLGAAESRLAVDLQVAWRGLAVHATAIWAQVAAHGLQKAYGRGAWSVQAGQVLPFSGSTRWQVLARLEQADGNDTTDGASTSGPLASFYPFAPHAALRRWDAGVTAFLRARKLSVSLLYRGQELLEGPRSLVGVPIVGATLGLYLQIMGP